MLYVCTGHYIKFWQDFFTSAEVFLLPGIHKEYFVFTDAPVASVTGADTGRVHVIEQANLGWPGNTLQRYAMFLRARAQIERFTHAYFFNANCIVLSPIGPTELMPWNEERFVACAHPGVDRLPKSRWPLETRRRSRAFLDRRECRGYLFGALNGGCAPDFMRAAEELARRIEEDAKVGIVARWHDESHWNRFIAENYARTRILPPSFLHPEGWHSLPTPKVLVRNKARLGGHSQLRGTAENWKGTLRRWAKRFLRR